MKVFLQLLSLLFQLVERCSGLLNQWGGGVGRWGEVGRGGSGEVGMGVRGVYRSSMGPHRSEGRTTFQSYSLLTFIKGLYYRTW